MAGQGATDGTDGLITRVLAMAAPFTDAAGAELLDVEVKGHPGRRIVRLIVDADGGVDVETCARLSREVGAALDAEDVVPGSYTLEVTSPGVNRPMRARRDFVRNVGRPVRIFTRRAEQRPQREIRGVLVQVDEDAVTLDVDGEPTRLALADVDYGRVQLPW